jgi:RND family efflux transporter MFP subunit
MKPIVLILLSFILSACGSGDGNGVVSTDAQENESLPVEAVTITRGMLWDSVEITGTVRGVEEAVVVSETVGTIKELSLRLGGAVEAGDVLVQVDDTVARLNMEQAQQQLEIARIDQATKEELFRGGGVSRAELARSQSAAAGAEARYRSVVKAYEDCSIVAPIDGFISFIGDAVARGNFIGQGTRIAGVVNLEELQITAGVGEQLVSLIQPGAATSVRIPAACGDELFPGEVSALAAGSDPATGSFAVVVQWENRCEGKVKSGMTALASIAPARQEEALLLPSGALIQQDGETFVMVDAEGTARLQGVETGRSLGNRRVVLSGLEEGERVIMSGTSLLSDGDPVISTIIGESGEWE